VIVSAPGKLILAGEYAVLEGGTAVVAAVVRRARARRDRAGREDSRFIDAAVRLAPPDVAGALEDIAVDTRELRDAGGIKLGLGSSAAATVAAVGAAYHATGRGIDRPRIHALAAAAHAEAQAGRGSGADIAAAVHGGVIAFAAGVARTIALPEVTWLPVWLGRPADTVALVAAIDAARAARGAIVADAIRGCAAAGAALAAAATAAQVIAAIGAGADAIDALAAATGVDLAPAELHAARALARRAGGELKTCGAGGGDVAIAALPAGADRSDLVRALRDAGLTPLDLPFDPRGVDIDPPRA